MFKIIEKSTILFLGVILGDFGKFWHQPGTALVCLGWPRVTFFGPFDRIWQHFGLNLSWFGKRLGRDLGIGEYLNYSRIERQTLWRDGTWKSKNSSRETRFLKRECPCGVPASLVFDCLLGSISRPVFITLFGLNLDANLHGLSIKASCYSMTLLGIPSWSSMELRGIPMWFTKAGRCSK